MSSLAIELGAAVLAGGGLERVVRSSTADRFWRSWLQHDPGLTRRRALTILGGAAGFAAVVAVRAWGVKPLGDQALASGVMLGFSGSGVTAISASMFALTRSRRISTLCNTLSLGRSWMMSNLDDRSSWKIHARVRRMTEAELATTVAKLMTTAKASLSPEVVDPYRKWLRAVEKAMRSWDPDTRQEGRGELQALCATLILRLRVMREAL